MFVLVSAQATEETELSEDTIHLINDVRGETAPLRDLETAEEAGYGKFLELATTWAWASITSTATWSATMCSMP
jgi:hypothetical protein